MERRATQTQLVAVTISGQNHSKLDELSTPAERVQLRPHAGGVYSLDNIPAAHARLETRNNGILRKIAIEVVLLGSQ